MFLDKSLSIAFLISTILHVTVLLPLPNFKNSSLKKTQPSFRVTYLVPEEIPSRKTRVKERPLATAMYEIGKKNAAELKIDSGSKTKENPVKKVVNLPKPAIEHPKIEIPPELPKEKEALYLDYYQSIRQRIRRLVVENYPRYIACGEVCLYFVLLSNGRLKEINVVEERSSHSRLLKEVSERSVRQASPFSPFPEDLNQKQLSFNVIISFELEK